MLLLLIYAIFSIYCSKSFFHLEVYPYFYIYHLACDCDQNIFLYTNLCLSNENLSLNTVPQIINYL